MTTAIATDSDRLGSNPGAAAQAASARGTILSGREAVNAAERVLCGVAAVPDGARAEGLALAGLRAAALLALPSRRLPEPGGGEKGGPGEPEVRVAAPFVVHTTRAGSLGAFSLVAESAQQAVDQCVVAHRLVAVTGGAGTCAVPPSVADDLAFVRLPGGHAGEGDDVLRAFDGATRALGRPCRPFTALHAEGAEHLIVATGLAAPLARRLVDLLRARGVSCGALSLSLLRPVVAPVAELLRKRASIVLLADATIDAGPALAEVARAAVDGTARVVTVELHPGQEADAVARIASALGGEINGDLGALRLGPPPAPSRSVAVAAVPADRWSEELLRGALSWLGDRVAVASPEAPVPGVVAIGVARAGMRPTVGGGYDVLFAAHPGLLSTDAIARLRSGGTVVVQSSAADAAALWAALSPAQRRGLAERKAHVKWIDGAVARTADAVADTRLLLEGAVLGACAGLGALLGPGAVATDSISAEGQGGVVLGGVAALRDAGDVPEVATARQAATGLPRLEAPGEGVDLGWRDLIRAFHVTGQGAWTGVDPLPTLPLVPVLLSSLLEDGAAETGLPLLLDEQGAVPLADVLRKAVASWEADNGASVAVGPALGRLLRAVRAALADAPVAPAGEVVGKALDAFAAAFQVSAEGAKALEREVAHVRAAIPAKARVVGTSRQAVLEVHAAALARGRSGAAKALAAEADVLARKLRDLLRVDDLKSPGARSAQAVGAGVGNAAGTLLDPAALAQSIGASRGAKAMAPERRARIERTLATLEAWLGRGAEPALVLHGGLLDGTALSGARVVGLADPLGAAIGAFDGRAAQMADALRALRVARLEAAGGYDPSRHDAAVARLAWESFTPDELRAVSPVVVAVDAAALWGSLASFSELLRSGRPVHVLVLEPAMGGAELTAGHSGIGYLAVAHRDAFVLQGTLGRGAHLAAGFERMARACRPAVAVVAEPAWGGPVPAEVQLEAAHQGRGTPCFVHDPDAGPTWAERFDLGGNPAPEEAWVRASAAVIGADGKPATVEGAFTFVHAAALDPGARPHLRMIPVEAWSDEQVEVSAWLAAGETGAPQVPYVEVVDEDGVVRRAVISRDLAWVARDRAQLWRVLGELAGERNEHAARAAAAARVAAEAEIERRLAEQAATHAAELEKVRTETAGEALERVARVLLDLDLAAAPAPRVAAAPAPAPASAPVAEAAPVAAAPAVEEEDVSFDDPYIDTPLCTTCNECVNLNPKMFKYNADKQAVLADVAAGTFAQLVAAAEKCSARCIHPGKPRKGDASATPELLARASAL